MIWLLAAGCVAAAIPAGLRWLRIAQREHYLAGSVSRFAWRWWTSSRLNLALAGAALVGLAASVWIAWTAFLVPLAQIGPVGLAVRGESGPLAWTSRLRRLAVASGGLLAVILAAGASAGLAWLLAAGVLLLPLLFDLALTALSPVEKARGDKWVEQARRKLAAVRPQVVAITGSYGKTSTKLYTAHLLEGRFRVVASPGSFNNRMGLARAVNEGLAPGTEVFVAEMGTYGKGEIAELCSWITPTVAAIVSIGPVHLERFGSEESIVEAKSEILDPARTGVICVDHPLLEELAARRASDLEVIEVSTGGSGRVVVADRVVVDGTDLGPAADGVFRANLAVAIGVCLAMGLEAASLRGRFEGLPVAEHRLSVARSASGVLIIDDTFNSNPAGAREGLRRLAELGARGRKVVVTPGMVELGPLQDQENRRFAREAAKTADHLIIVGGTNREALAEGSANGGASVTVVASRDEAVAWVREHLGDGDAVLYENDLPDHYP